MTKAQKDTVTYSKVAAGWKDSVTPPPGVGMY